MQFLKVIALSAAMTAGLTSTAYAQAVGSVSSVSGDVLVQRGGSFIQLKDNDPIFEGDKVFTRDGGSVTIDANGCAVALGGGQLSTVDSGFCTNAPTSVADAGLPTDVAVAGGAGAGGGTGLLVGGVLVAGVAAAAAGGGGGSDGGGAPSSP